MIECMVRSLLTDQPQTLIGAGGANDYEPGRAGKLHSGQPDSATGTVYQNRVSRLGMANLKQGAVCRSVGDGDGCSFGETNRIGQQLYLVRFAKRELCIRPSERTPGVDASAAHDSSHPR